MLTFIVPSLSELKVSHKTRQSLSFTLPSSHRSQWISFRNDHGGAWWILDPCQLCALPFHFCFENFSSRNRNCPKPTPLGSQFLSFSPLVETDSLIQFVLHLGCAHSVLWWQWVQFYLWWLKNSTQLTLHFKNWKISQKSILFFFSVSLHFTVIIHKPVENMTGNEKM